MKIVLATHNRDKEKELQDSLRGLDVEIQTLSEYSNVGEIEETGTTLLENSLLKARTVFAKTGHPAIADDTGLEVDALDGGPGIYSARFAGLNATYEDRKSTRLNSSHALISYAVFCLKKKNEK